MTSQLLILVMYFSVLGARRAVSVGVTGISVMLFRGVSSCVVLSPKEVRN